MPPDRGTLRLRPLRLEPPMAMDDNGLACPVSLPVISRSRRISPPAPSTTSPLTLKTIHEQRVGASREGALFPAIHRSRLAAFVVAARPAAGALSLPSPSTTIPP